MQAHKFSFVLLLVGGIVASFLMLLSKQELALMYLQERDLEKAEQLYEEMLQNNKLQRENLSPLTRIYVEQGYPNKAIEVYESYLEGNPGDINVEKKLAKLYFDSRRHYDYQYLLEKISAKQPSIENLDELARLYKHYGNTQKERSVLQRLVQLDPSRRDDFQRLIQIQSAAGNFVEAEQTLAVYIDAQNPMTLELAELRLRLLISANRKNEALAWMKTWLDEDQDNAQRFIAMFYSAGHSSNLVDALDTPVSISPNEMPSWLVKALVKNGWNERKIIFLEQFTSRLSEKKQKALPVILARLALFRDDMPAFNQWLQRAEQLAEYDSVQMTTLAEIYLSTQRMEKALGLLSNLADLKIPSAFYTETALFTIKMGKAEKALKVYTQLKDRHQKPDIEYAWALLCAAEGQESMLQWLDKGGAEELTKQQWLDLYYLASESDHNKLALAIAVKLQSRLPGINETQLLSEAKIKAGLNSEALVLLKQQVKSPDLSTERREQLALLLLKAGDKAAAVEQFQLLAEKEGPKGKNVGQLLYIWGPLPEESALDWLETQAKKAAPSELAYWWQHLVQVGGAKRVITMAASKERLRPLAEQTFINALVAVGDTSEAKWQLKKHASKSRNPRRLENLAKTAHSEGFRKTEEHIWRRLHKVDPKHPQANRGLGLAAFSRDDRGGTTNHLASYLNNSKGDWESAFFLAEVLYAEGRRRNAEPYFQRSIEHINKKRKPPKRLRVARALMHYRLGKTEMALDEYDKLIAEYPQDQQLRANYSTLLIDEGRFAKARRLLGEKR